MASSIATATMALARFVVSRACPPSSTPIRAASRGETRNATSASILRQLGSRMIVFAV
jgi:hypothetical protein